MYSTIVLYTHSWDMAGEILLAVRVKFRNVFAQMIHDGPGVVKYVLGHHILHGLRQWHQHGDLMACMKMCHRIL